MTHVTCRPTAKNRDQPRNPTLGSRVWGAIFTYLFIGVQSRGIKPTELVADKPLRQLNLTISLTLTLNPNFRRFCIMHNAPFAICTPSNTKKFPRESVPANGIWIGSSVFAQLPVRAVVWSVAPIADQPTARGSELPEDFSFNQSI